MSNTNKSGIQLIAEERQRQIEKLGYDEDHDSMETAFQLSGAAAMYIANAINKDFYDHSHYDDNGPCARFQLRQIDSKDMWAEQWPWNDRDGRLSSDILTSLVTAGALIAAEIDRLKKGELL